MSGANDVIFSVWCGLHAHAERWKGGNRTGLSHMRMVHIPVLQLQWCWIVLLILQDDCRILLISWNTIQNSQCYRISWCAKNEDILEFGHGFGPDFLLVPLWIMEIRLYWTLNKRNNLDHYLSLIQRNASCFIWNGMMPMFNFAPIPYKQK